MALKIVNKKQSLYILLVTLAIASISFLTIHGINSAISNSNNQPAPLVTVNRDTLTQAPRESLNSTSESLDSTAVNPSTTISDQNQNLSAASPDPTCKIAGCNHELCVDANDNTTVSSCNNTEANKCYIGGDCRRQAGQNLCGWTPNATQTRCLNDSNFATQDLRVMEIRYISNPNDIPFQPDLLSSELQADIKEASTYHKYKDSLAKPAIQVNVVDVMNINGTRENVENYWYGSYYKMIQDLGLCQKIQDEKIDQIWMWVDPRQSIDPTEPAGAPGLEYVISSKYFLKNNGDPGVARPPFCEGRFSFTIMGFDYTRPSDFALHSFSHFMEGIEGGIEGGDLFGKYVGLYNSSIQGRNECGNVHFPPNGTVDYEYANATAKPTYCQNWNPQGTGALQSLNCNAWGCNQGGYLTWWLQNMPGFNNTLNYQSKKIPPWWDFIVDIDSKVQKYNPDPSYYVDNFNINLNNVDLNSNCSCTSTDENGDPVTVNQCWASIRSQDLNCYQCTGDTFYQVPQFLCN